jgi:hypothetical protein
LLFIAVCNAKRDTFQRASLSKVPGHGAAVAINEVREPREN